MIVAHPTFPGCLKVPAVDTAHAWRIVRACDAGGFRCGFPSVDWPVSVAVTGDMGDADRVAALEALRARVIAE